jgi:hypothetical protein
MQLCVCFYLKNQLCKNNLISMLAQGHYTNRSYQSPDDPNRVSLILLCYN